GRLPVRVRRAEAEQYLVERVAVVVVGVPDRDLAPRRLGHHQLLLPASADLAQRLAGQPAGTGTVRVQAARPHGRVGAGHRPADHHVALVVDPDRWRAGTGTRGSLDLGRACGTVAA